MYRTPAILRLSVHRKVKPQPVATLNAPSKPPVAQCAAFIRLCRDSLVPLLDRSAMVTAKELRILKELRPNAATAPRRSAPPLPSMTAK